MTMVNYSQNTCQKGLDKICINIYSIDTKKKGREQK